MDRQYLLAKLRESTLEIIFFNIYGALTVQCLEQVHQAPVLNTLIIKMLYILNTNTIRPIQPFWLCPMGDRQVSLPDVASIPFCQFQFHSIPFGQFQFYIKFINSKCINSVFYRLLNYYFLP